MEAKTKKSCTIFLFIFLIISTKPAHGLGDASKVIIHNIKMIVQAMSEADNGVVLVTNDLDSVVMDANQVSAFISVMSIENLDQMKQFQGQVPLMVAVDVPAEDMISMLSDFLHMPWVWVINQPVDLVKTSLQKLNLRLDSKLFLYDASTNSIIETYGLQGQLVTQHVATLVGEEALVFSDLNIWNRRRDLQGMPIRVGIPNAFPYAIPEEDDQGRIRLSGFFGDIVTDLSQTLNFSIVPHILAFDVYGSILSNGSFVGYASKVTNGHIDVLAADLSVNAERTEFLSFSVPLLQISTRLIAKRPSYKLDWLAFVKVISWEFGSVLACFILLLMTVMSLVMPEQGPSRSVSFVLCALANRELSFDGTRLSCRMLSLSILLLGFIVFSSYCAMIVSRLSVKKLDLPFQDLEGFAQSSFGFPIVQGNTRLYFKESPTDHLFAKIYKEKIAPYDHMGEDIIKSLASNKDKKQLPSFIMDLLNDSFVWLHDKDLIMSLAEYPCQVIDIPDDIMSQYLALAFPLEGDFNSLFNFFLSKLIEGGHVHKTFVKYRDGETKKTRNMQCPQDDVGAQIGYQSVTLLFLILGAGVILASCVLLFELTKVNK